MRPRIAKPAQGTRWTIRETARLLNVGVSVIHYQISKGKVKADAAGVDALSAYEWYKTYEPHKDNAARRVKARTIPQMQAASTAHANGNGHGTTNAQGGHVIAQPRKQTKGELVLSTREWVGRFYLDQARAKKAGNLNPKTKVGYDWTFGIETRMGNGQFEILETTPSRFVDKFETVPFDRRDILDYLHGLEAVGHHTNGQRVKNYGQSLSAGSKGKAHRNLVTFYAWLGREFNRKDIVPDLTQSNLPPPKKGGPAFTQDEIRAMLALAHDHSEFTIVQALAQVGCREGELCSLAWDADGRSEPSSPPCACCGPNRRRGSEMLTPAEDGGGGWVHAYGKTTSANDTGKRVLYLPRETFEALSKHLRIYKVMSLRGRRLSGERDGEKALRDFVRLLAIRAGCYVPGKNTHGFRRAYEAEFQHNGGSALMMDELLGHRSKKDMRSLYYNAPHQYLMEAANRYAPRKFLQQALASAPLPGLTAAREAVPA